MRGQITSLSLFLFLAAGCTTRESEPKPAEQLPSFVDREQEELTSTHHDDEHVPQNDVVILEGEPELTLVESPVEEEEFPSHDQLTVRRFIVGEGIENREPIVPEAFTIEQDRIYAFLDLRNDGDEDRVVTVSFRHPSGRETGGVELNVPARAPRWRTWAYSRFVKVPGEWTAIVRAENNEVIAEQLFIVE